MLMGKFFCAEMPSLYHYSRQPVKPGKAQAFFIFTRNRGASFARLLPKYASQRQYALQRPGVLR
jgi:hypothetical protein